LVSAIKFAQKTAKLISETVTILAERTPTADICAHQISIGAKMIVQREHVPIIAASIRALEFPGKFFKTLF
jgi:hypothetical protein